jgi:hypothetical protein
LQSIEFFNQGEKMKAILMISVLLSGAVSFAGPEDHIQDQVCYSIDNKDQAKAISEVPLQLCFEKLTVFLADPVNRTQDSIEVYSYFNYYQTHLQNLKLTSLIRQTEDSYAYQAESVLVDRAESHCEDGVKVTLQLEGEVDFTGYGNIGEQRVTLIQETKADVCHSTAQTEVFHYVRTY